MISRSRPRVGARSAVGMALGFSLLLTLGAGCRAVPESGFVYYIDPAPKGTMQRKSRLAAQSLLFIVGEASETDALGLDVQTGGLGWRSDNDGGGSTTTFFNGGDLLRDTSLSEFKLTEKTPIYWLTGSELLEVLDALEDAGLSSVPLHKGAGLPDNGEPFFVIEDGSGERLVYPRPMPKELVARGVTPEEGRKIATAWLEAVRIVFYLGGYFSQL